MFSPMVWAPNGSGVVRRTGPRRLSAVRRIRIGEVIQGRHIRTGVPRRRVVGDLVGHDRVKPARTTKQRELRGGLKSREDLWGKTK